MRYNKIRKMDISNGSGIRVSIFVQGCTFNCKDCFNPETHDFNGGKEFTNETLGTLLELCGKPEIKGLSILGGEPLHPKNRETVVDIMRAFKYKYPDKDIWLWTGYTFEDLYKNRDDDISSMFLYLDYMVDGRFISEEKNFKLKWAGSNNQRVINIKETFKGKGLVLENNL